MDQYIFISICRTMIRHTRRYILVQNTQHIFFEFYGGRLTVQNNFAHTIN